MSKLHTPSTVLIKTREERDLSISDFCLEFGISRPTYYKWEERGDMDLNVLQDIALNKTTEWQGMTAIKLIRLVDINKVPCRCQTEIGDCGICPRHIEATKEAVTA